MPPKTQAKAETKPKTEEKKEQPKKEQQPKKEEPKAKPAAAAAAKKEEKKAPAAAAATTPAPAKKAEEPKKAEAKKTTAAPAKKAEEPKKAETKKAEPAKKTETKKAESGKKEETKKGSKKEETKKPAAAAAASSEKKAEAKKSGKKETTTTKATKESSKGEGKKRKAPESSGQAVKKQKTEKKTEKTDKTALPAIVGTKSPRNFTIGNDIQPKRDLTRFVKWPRYILMQRQRRVLQHRLKVPPSINQFTRTLDTNTAANLFKILNKYRPEDHAAKMKRLMKIAAGKARVKKEKPSTVKSGINHVTKLIEEKKAALVVIAHDVDPIELVLYLPALCRKQGIPYCFVKGKARLGQLVHRKTATAVAIKSVKPDDRAEFGQLLTVIRANYNDKYEEMKKKWGGGIMGLKSQAVSKQREKVKKQEEKKKAIKFK